MHTQKTVTTYYAEDNNGKAVVCMGPNGPYIDYYDAAGHLFFTEDYDKETLSYVENLAQEWSQGFKQLNG